MSRTELLNEFTFGWFEDDRWQVALLVQLRHDLTGIKSTNQEPGGSGKPKSRPPMDLSNVDLIYECVDEVRRVEDNSDCSLSRLEKLRYRARTVLGYEVGMMIMPDMVCHVCGGPLIVACDASSAVECAEQCGVSYPTCTWLDLLAQREAS